MGFTPSQELPSYLMAYEPDEIEGDSPAIREMLSVPQPFTLGIENSKRFRALSVYCALISLGARGFQEIVERNVQFARDVAEWMTNGDGKDWYEVLNLEPITSPGANGQLSVPLNIVLFRAKSTCPVEQFRPGQPYAERKLLLAINKDRKMYLTPGPDGALRMAVCNWMTGLGVTSDGLTDMEIVLATLTKVMQ
jgi:glutamate/tyrosine decarboxylase-like PLP-dependent enzyme